MWLAYTQWQSGIMSFWSFYRWINNEKLKYIESSSGVIRCIISYMDTQCAISVWHYFWMSTSSLYHTHTQLSVRSFSPALKFQHRFNYKDQEGFPIPRKEGHLLVDVQKIYIYCVKIGMSVLCCNTHYEVPNYLWKQREHNNCLSGASWNRFPWPSSHTQA